MSSRFFLFLCSAVFSTAQNSPFTVDDAIRLAWAHDPAVAALSLTPELSRAREEQAGIRPSPEWEFRGAMPVKNDSEWVVGLSVNQRLPRHERIKQARTLAQLDGEIAALHLGEQRRRVAGEVRQLYYEAVVQQARRDVARRAIAIQHELQATLERHRAAGEIGTAEIHLLAMEVSRAEQAFAFTEAEFSAVIQRLRSRLRLAANAPVVIDTSLEAIIARPIPSEPATLVTARPALALATHRVHAAEAALALARSETRGDWTVGGGVDFERRANDFTGRLEDEPRVSVSASVPWSRGTANRGDIREKQAALRIAEAELIALRNELNAEIATTAATARALQPVLAAYLPSLTPSAAIPDTLRAVYERGEITSVQLAQSRQQRFVLETDFLNAAMRYAAALAEAETAAGIVPAHP